MYWIGKVWSRNNYIVLALTVDDVLFVYKIFLFICPALLSEVLKFET